MGVFIVCWSPFFVVNLLSGFCLHCIWNEELISAVVTWLGWINSSMNPVIYACWSRDFRRSVALLLCLDNQCFCLSTLYPSVARFMYKKSCFFYSYFVPP
jgi:hypothetical protein